MKRKGLLLLGVGGWELVFHIMHIGGCYKSSMGEKNFLLSMFLKGFE